MAKGQSARLLCRQHLFRAQVARFACCEDRQPTLRDVRRLWRETGFKAL